MKTPRTTLTEQLVGFAWAAWAELGVSGWKGPRAERCIDPEALMLLTGSLGDADARLRDESLDWCATYRDLLSRSRLSHLHKIWPEAKSWQAYSAASSKVTGESWPGAGSARRRELSGRSRLLLQDRPALVGLRIRAAFGATARSEVVRALLLDDPGKGVGAAEIAEEAGCTKRNAASALTGLGRAGLVTASRTPRGDLFRVAKGEALAELFGPLPSVRTSFLATCRAAWILARGLDALEKASDAVRSVEARRVLTVAAPDLHRLAETPSSPTPGRDAWSDVRGWAVEWIDRLVI